MATLVAVDGAKIMCPGAIGPVISTVEGTCDVEATGCDGSILTESDKVVSTNIIPFVSPCKLRPFPKFMPLIHLPCQPIVNGEWKKTAQGFGDSNERILTENSCINCERGALIEITNPNQNQINTDTPVANEDGLLRVGYNNSAMILPPFWLFDNEESGDNVTIVFDGEKVVAIDNDSGIVLESWDAVSGLVDENQQTQPETSGIKNEGPLPEGKYTVNADDSNRHRWYKRDWGSTDAWGHIRTVIEPQEGTDLLGREPGTMYFHGGNDPESRGCIDLTDDNEDFHDWLDDYDGDIEVIVDYEGYGADDKELLDKIEQQPIEEDQKSNRPWWVPPILA